MIRNLYVFRPEPGLSVTLETAASMGLSAQGCPLFEVRPVDWQSPSAQDFDGLLVGSSNVFRHGGKQLEKLSKLPVYAVGEATADGAREKGFRIARIGTGGLQGVLDAMERRDRRLLRLAGAAKVDLVPPPGMVIETRTVYRTRPLMIADDIAMAMRAAGGVALLHSGEAARRLAQECDRLEIPRRGITIAALGPRIAELVGDGWQSIHVAAQPLDAELLALAAQLCQTQAGS